MKKVFTLWQNSKNIQSVSRVQYKLTLYKNGKIKYAVCDKSGERKGVYTLEKYRATTVIKELKDIFKLWKKIPSDDNGKDYSFKIRFGGRTFRCCDIQKSGAFGVFQRLCRAIYEDECLDFSAKDFRAFDDKKSAEENLDIALKEYPEQKKNIFYTAYLLRIFTRLNIVVKFDEKLARQFTEKGNCRKIPFYLWSDDVLIDNAATEKFRDFIVTACRRGAAMFRFRNECSGWSDEAMLTLIAQRISI